MTEQKKPVQTMSYSGAGMVLGALAGLFIGFFFGPLGMGIGMIGGALIGIFVMPRLRRRLDPPAQEDHEEQKDHIK